MTLVSGSEALSKDSHETDDSTGAVDIVVAALKSHYGTEVTNRRVKLRKEFRGATQIGGAMEVKCSILTPDGFVPATMEPSDENGLLTQEARNVLGQEAEAHWNDPDTVKWRRDSSSYEPGTYAVVADW